MDRITKNQLISLSKNDFKKEFGINCKYISLAPGRINIIGEHTDYNLGLAMPIAIDRWICVCAVYFVSNLRKNIYWS